MPRHEERRERYKSKDIARMIMERFPGLTGYVSASCCSIRSRGMYETYE